jgi:hypothetical protein
VITTQTRALDFLEALLHQAALTPRFSKEIVEQTSLSFFLNSRLA